MGKPKPKEPEYMASISVSIWVDVPVEADTLEAALTHAREIKLDKILEHANNVGVIDCSNPKITGISTVSIQPEEL